MRKRNSMARLLALARPYVWPLFFAFLCLVAANGAELIKPYIFKVVIDDYIVGGRQGQGLMTIPGLSIAYFVTVVVGALMTILQIKWMNRVGQDIIRDLRARVFSHIQHMPLSVLDTYSSGRLVTRGTNDVEALSEFFTDVMLGLLKDAILLVGIMAVMLAMEWRLALVSFAILPLIVAIVWSMRRLLRPMHARIKHLTGRINGFIAETLSGLRVVQSFNHQKELLGRFQALNDDYNQASKLRVTLNSINRPIIDVVNTLAVALVLWYGMGRVLNATLPIGLLYAFTTYIKQFFEPIMDFAEKYDTIQSAETSADRIFELLDQEEALEALDEGEPLPAVRGRVEFDHVWFAYSGENWVLKDVSFVLEPGQHLAVVGHTGSGKSTLISLICRFYDVQRGRILVDGLDIATLRKADLRRHIATVLQDPFLFSGSIYDNVALGEDMDEERVRWAIDTSCAAGVVAQLADGLRQPVRERGCALSVGQRQLIAFARAIAHDPAILILDEATAHIDTQTEMLLQTSLTRVSEGRTTITVAHRLSTIRQADMIILIDRGEIVERGTHEELIALGGRYWQLYQAQLAS